MPGTDRLRRAGSIGASDRTVTIAMVSNSQMTDARSLASQFEAENPDIDLRFVTLSENEARAKITASTAMGGGEFDVVMISNYETPQWAEYGWLTNLGPFIEATEGYDQEDFIPSLREALSYDGDMYSVPFYGESSFLMYRRDLFLNKRASPCPTRRRGPRSPTPPRNSTAPTSTGSACAASRAGVSCWRHSTP